MNRKWAFYIIAAVLVAVAIVATTNTYRLNRSVQQQNDYIETTLLRDTAQERCQLETIHVLRKWGKSDEARINVLKERNLALIPLFEAILNQNNPSNIIPAEQSQAVLDAIYRSEQVLNHEEQVFRDNPLPDC